MNTWPTPDVPRLPDTGLTSPVKVFDSTSRALRQAAAGDQASLYACGITPYDATHLGHANTYLTFDLLYRAWLDQGLEVTYTSCITDCDDPLLQRAEQTGVDWRDLAAQQTQIFREDMQALNILPPATWRSVVESIDDVVGAVEALEAMGAAYRVPVVCSNHAQGSGNTHSGHTAGGDAGHKGCCQEGSCSCCTSGEEASRGACGQDIYADLSADVDFGKVSGLDQATMASLFAQRGGDPDRPGKRGSLDPLLWRAARAGEPSWPGRSLGAGRPGWHIECAVISRRGLGLPFDVQGGGADLLFPHHEMSTSHMRLISGLGSAGAPRVHVHAGLLSYQGQKMSKSLGNLVFVSRLRAQGVDPMAVRLALLAHHYREEWEWTDSDLDRGAQRLDQWRAAISWQRQQWAYVCETSAGDQAESQAGSQDTQESHVALGVQGAQGPWGSQGALALLEAMRSALRDDLDAPLALKHVDRWCEKPTGNPELVAQSIHALLGVVL